VLSLTVRPWPGATHCFLLQNNQTEIGAHPASNSVGSSVPSRGPSGRSLNLITHFHLVSRLVMSETSLYFP
jgi:hypothetical protein